MQQCADVTLYIAGDGEERESLVGLARKLHLENRVFFLGSLAQDELAEYYATADALILASSREGWANVLLESMACGTPVVATNVGGTPEVIQEPEAGLLVERTVSGLADGIKTLFSACSRTEQVLYSTTSACSQWSMNRYPIASNWPRTSWESNTFIWQPNVSRKT